MRIKTTILTLLACLSVSVERPCDGHELEDGFVERAVQIVVRDQTATITYFVGLNETTMASVVEQWQSETATDVETAVSSIVEQFRSLALANIAKGLDVSIGAEAAVLKPVKLEPSPKHHFTFIATMEFQLPVSKSSEITINDRNFGMQTGAARYSIKALGSAMILKSNVAPIIIRAKRHELESLTADQRRKTCQIAATVAISQPLLPKK